MLPYIQQPELSLGPVTIHAFGVLVLCNIVVGTQLLTRRAAQGGISPAASSRFINWILLGGFVGAHLVDRLIYFPAETMQDPMSLLRVWSGISSFGGFLGGTIAGLIYLARHATAAEAWVYCDSFAFAFPFGWIFGRLGCSIAFDHPGSRTSFFLGEVDHAGIVRHNLGLEECLYTVGIAAVFLLLSRRSWPRGFWLGMLLVLYAPFRFAIDFMRVIDARYWALTPGQYGSFGCLVLGIIILSRLPPTPSQPAR